MGPARTGIVLVNYKGWRDTISCLESLYRLTGVLFDVIVCDNGSEDVSWENIRSHVSTRYEGAIFAGARRSAAGAAAIECCQYRCAADTAVGSSGPRKILLIRTRRNLGFAGGNNVGIEFALRDGADYIWLLNNDTVVEPGSLSTMVSRMQAVPNAGMCGCTLLDLQAPDRVQALGGSRYLKWAGIGVPLGAGRPWPLAVRPEAVESQLSYVAGASMLVSRDFIETVGPMDERYFLYFEEMDWVLRARGRYALAYAPGAIVYHKEGGAIGSSGTGRKRSPRSFFWLARSRVLFTLRHFPAALPSTMLFSLVNCLQWALRKRDRRILSEGLAGLASGVVAALRGGGEPP